MGATQPQPTLTPRASSSSITAAPVVCVSKLPALALSTHLTGNVPLAEGHVIETWYAVDVSHQHRRLVPKKLCPGIFGRYQLVFISIVVVVTNNRYPLVFSKPSRLLMQLAAATRSRLTTIPFRIGPCRGEIGFLRLYI